ncbi:hypothetical protein [Luteolibacter marinus]|uniref:hypothetical protein n=1 Tax=Luteolibacter marinus TaxID=2776705 RepID=UPI001865DA90|nr:hypothetical protein [Luteolibacter marinus]
MRALLFLLPVLLASCGQQAPQYRILEQSKHEISLRESWSDTAYIVVKEVPGDLRVTWKVRAGQFDRSDFPSFKGIRLVPGTERELCFTRAGCLIGYTDRSNPCLDASGDTASAPVIYPEK